METTTLAAILLYDLLDSFTAFTLYTAFGKSFKQFRDALNFSKWHVLFMHLFPSFNKRTLRLLLLLKIISSLVGNYFLIPFSYSILIVVQSTIIWWLFGLFHGALFSIDSSATNLLSQQHNPFVSSNATYKILSERLSIFIMQFRILSNETELGGFF